MLPAPRPQRKLPLRDWPRRAAIRRHLREAIDRLEPDQATIDHMRQVVMSQVQAARDDVPRRRASLHTGTVIAALTIAVLKPVLFPIVSFLTLAASLRSARQTFLGRNPAARLEKWLVHAATRPVIGGVRLAIACASGYPRWQAFGRQTHI